VRLYLVDGTPDGLVVAEIGNWIGMALCSSRARLGDLLRRPEAARTGVYLLAGADPDIVGGMKVYVGEADDIAARLPNHLRSEDRDFFDRVVIVVAKDTSLTKAHVRYLEGRLIKAVREAKTAALANATAPDFQRLPEADRSDMDAFLDQARLVLPLLGFDVFRSRAVPRAASVDAGPLFVFSTAGASATAHETIEGFVVMAGSTARKATTATIPASYQALRDRLVRTGQLVDGPSADLFQFAKDVVFDSPSAAASVVAGRSAAGPREWKVDATRQTYRDCRMSAWHRSGTMPLVGSSSARPHET
jgi:hypothetical protein